MLCCETCEVLKKISFKENCWSTASGFQEHFGRIAFLGLPAAYKRLTVFALKIFKDNQNIPKVVSSISLMKENEWYLAQSPPKRVSQKRVL